MKYNQMEQRVTSWHQLVPVGTGWYTLVPVDTGWYRSSHYLTNVHNKQQIVTQENNL